LDTVDIGSKVRGMRKKAGLTQENLADLTGWSKVMISKIENNHRSLLAIEYLKLVELLGGVRKVAKFTFQYRDRKPAVLIKNPERR
jgi:transcriptional regulator with XRE-family HTH domain